MGRTFKTLAASLAAISLAACGGGGGGGGGVPSSFSVGGTVQGLAGSGLVLQLNGSNNVVSVVANAPFTFPNTLASGTAYNVSVLTQPGNPSQNCAVSNGSGVIGNSNVTNVSVTCANSTYTVGGTVSGLTGTGLVLRLNGGGDLPVSANGSFAFSTALATGTAYAVTVATQPSSPSQTCNLTNGSGTYAGSNVSNVAVTCSTNAYAVGGAVSGLTGSGLVLQLNDGSDLAIASNGPFAFPAKLASGTSYRITVLAHPAGPRQICAVANGSGTMESGDVSATVTCADFGGFAYVADRGSNAIFGYSIDAATGALAALANSPFTAGQAPSSIAVDPSGTFAYVTNSADDNISAYRIDRGTGTLTPLVGSPFTTGDQPEFIVIEPAGKYAYVASGANTIWAYLIDAGTGALTAVVGSPFAKGLGSGGRDSLAVHPNGQFAYAVNTQAESVSGYRIDTQTGALIALTGSPFSTAFVEPPPFVDYKENPHLIVMHPSGNYAFLWATGKLDGRRCVARVDSLTGALTVDCSSSAPNPYSMAVHPNGKYLYFSHDFVSLGFATFDVSTGKLANQPFSDPGEFSRAMTIHPDGLFLFTVSSAPNRFISAYRIDASTGMPTLVPNSPFAGGFNGTSIAVTR